MKRNLHAGRPSSGGLSLNVFTEAELDDIHLGSLEVLERTGVWVEADDALDVFSDGGCVVDRETRMVRIPPYLVEDASAPPRPRASSVAATRNRTWSSRRVASTSPTSTRAS